MAPGPNVETTWLCRILPSGGRLSSVRPHPRGLPALATPASPERTRLEPEVDRRLDISHGSRSGELRLVRAGSGLYLVEDGVEERLAFPVLVEPRVAPRRGSLHARDRHESVPRIQQVLPAVSQRRHKRLVFLGVEVVVLAGPGREGRDRRLAERPV